MNFEPNIESLPRISVVVGTKNASRTIEACLTSLLAQAELAGAEIIVADASSDNTATLVLAQFPQVKLLENDSDELVPLLWKQGLEAARAPIVAFTIGQCVPVADWLNQIVTALEGSAAAVGGPLIGPEGGSRRDWALYFSRYSRFLPGGEPGRIDDIAGDNAAYRRAALELCRPEWRQGFWENLVNARLLAKGETLLWEPKVAVDFGTAEPLADIARVRFRHGRHYASTRIGNTLLKRLLRFPAAPLLVPVLLARIYGRVKQEKPDYVPRFWRALPFVIFILLAWSAGEASGYLWPKRPTA